MVKVWRETQFSHCLPVMFCSVILRECVPAGVHVEELDPILVGFKNFNKM